MKDKIFQFVQMKGPLLSKDVMKHFNLDSIYAGAYLSELVQDKKILYSKFKVGTSPMYYTPEQKTKLVVLLDHLNPKDKETFSLLKEKKVLRDEKIPTINRVGCRNLPDFAIPLNVTIQGKKEIFWKWYLLNNEEASVIIKQVLDGPKLEVQQSQAKEQEVQPPIREQPATQPVQPIAEPIQPPKEESISKEKLLQLKELLEKQKQEVETEKIALQQKSIDIEENLKKKFDDDINKIKEDQKTLIENQLKKIKELENKQKDTSKTDEKLKQLESKHSIELENLKKKHDIKLQEYILNSNKEDEKDKTIEELQNRINDFESDLPDNKIIERQQSRIDELKEKCERLEANVIMDDEEQTQLESKNIEEEEDVFVKMVNVYFKDKNIEILNYNLIKKESEAEFSIIVPSVIGRTEYYCRAKDKKKLNEGDLATAFVVGQIKKLPTLFLSPGELTKKADKMLNKEFKNTLVFKQLENGS